MSLSRRMHSADIMGPASCVLKVIYYWTSVCVILCTCGASAVQYCSTNTTDVNRICTVKTCTTEGLPKLPTFPDVKRCAINITTNYTRLIELLEPCLPEITTTTEQPTTLQTTTQVPGTDITDSSTVKDFTTTNDTITHGTTLGSTQGTPLTTDIDSTAVMPTATTQDLNTDEVRTTRTTSPIANTRGHILTTPSTLPITTSSEVRHNFTTLPPKVTIQPPGEPWKIVLIVFACILAVLLILSVVYFCIRKKNVNCKVHSESDIDSKPADKSLSPAIQGGTSPTPSTPSPSGGQVINTAHVPDPKVDEDSRNRTFSTGSRTGDTSILMPADTKGTSQPEPKKKKKKNKKKGSNGIELAPVQPQEAAYNPVQTTDKVV